MRDYRLIDKQQTVEARDYLKKVQINIAEENCFECGACHSNFEEYFNFKKGVGIVHLQEADMYESEIEEIVNSCPVEAINIAEQECQ